MKKAVCLFCGSDDLSNEHVFPKWLLGYLGIKLSEFEYTRFSKYGDVKSYRKHNLNNFLNGHVCKKCNNEYLSRIENESMALLKAINEGDKSILNTNSQAILKWVYKTAIQLNYCANCEHIVPPSHYEYFRNSGIPENVFIDFAYSNFKTELFWWQGKTVILNFEDKIEKAVRSKIGNTYNITMQIGTMLFRVTFLDRLELIKRKGLIGIQLYNEYLEYDSKLVTDPMKYSVNNEYVVK